MKRRAFFGLGVGALACAHGSSTSPRSANLDFGEALARLETHDRQRFSPPRALESEAFSRWILAWARGQVDSRSLEQLAHQSWAPQSWLVEGQSLWCFEIPARRGRGAGRYLFRKSAQPGRHLLQAPHIFHDMQTGAIALAAFLGEPGFDALFCNSMHRYRPVPNRPDRTESSPSDVCHTPDHMFTRASQGWLRSRGGGQVTQLHGFASAGLGASLAVLADGAGRVGDPRLLRRAQMVRAALDPSLAVSPDDTELFGALGNVQGKAIRAMGGQFLHLELGTELRADLAASRTRSAALGRAIFGGGGG